MAKIMDVWRAEAANGERAKAAPNGEILYGDKTIQSPARKGQHFGPIGFNSGAGTGSE